MYITKTDFDEYSPSTDIPESEFDELAERASDVIDTITFNRIELAGGLSAYDSDTQAAIKKATCAQVQYMYENGGVDAVNLAGIQSGSIGKFSYTLGQTDSIPVAPLARTYLFKTGLAYRGVCK